MSTQLAPLCHACCDRATDSPACLACGYETCRPCARRGVLEVDRASAVCGGCRRAWSTEEAISRLGRTFWSGPFRRARREVLLARERPLLAGTEEAAREERERRVRRQEMRDLAALARAGEWQEYDALRARARERVREERMQRIQANSSLPPARRLLARCGACGADVREEEEGREGFRCGACGACGARTCLACGAVLGEGGHSCDPGSVETRATIERECRPCVRCRAPSARVEGCSTMWCAKCHAFWDWETGRLIERRGTDPHNPDHRAWLAATGRHRLREADDVPCGGIPEGPPLHTALLLSEEREVRSNPFFWDDVAVAVTATEALLACQRARIASYPRRARGGEEGENGEEGRRAEDDDGAREALRVAHLLGDLDEARLAAGLERAERAAALRDDVADVLEGLVFSGADLLQRFCEGEDSLRATVVHLEALRSLFDSRLAQLGMAHARCVPRLGPTWRWTMPGERRRGRQ